MRRQPSQQRISPERTATPEKGPKKTKKKLPDYKEYIELVSKGADPNAILGKTVKTKKKDNPVIELKPVEMKALSPRQSGTSKSKE